jgi:tetratricopeptide (TPR) repeat protein
MPLALLGIGLSWARRRQVWPLLAFVLGSQLGLTPFFLLERFRLPLTAVITLFVGLAAIWLTDRGRQRQWRGAALALLITAFLGALLTLPRAQREPGALRAGVGELLLQQGRHAEALGEFLAARGTGARVGRLEIRIAEAYAGLQRYEDALRALRLAVRSLQDEARDTGRPARDQMSYCYELSGDLLARIGRASQARIHYDAAVRWGADELRVQRKLRRLSSPDGSRP